LVCIYLQFTHKWVLTQAYVTSYFVSIKLLNLFTAQRFFLFSGTLFFACDSKEDESDGSTNLVGQDGNTCFNLQFTNADNIYLDLHVRTPSWVVIFYLNRGADQGILVVDCLCGNCASGPNKNIFW